MTLALCILITLIALLGMYVVGRKNKNGWLIGILSQVGWCVYAVVANDHSLFFPAAVYGGMALYNYLKWTGEHVNTSSQSRTHCIG